VLFKLEEFEIAGFSFSCGKKEHFENGGAFRKLCHDHRDFPDRVFFKQMQI